MAAGPLQLDFGLTCPVSTCRLQSISTLRSMPELARDIEQFGDLREVSCRKCQTAAGEEGMSPEVLQESRRQHSIGDPIQWMDDRRTIKWPPWSPDFGHRISKQPLWLNNGHEPAFMDSQRAALEDGKETPPDSALEGQGEIERLAAQFEIGMCRKLCENGRISDAVHALNLQVQQGCQVQNKLFYLVLKSCIAHKDLVMGRRTHALTIKSGYEGDAFLATHLISLYASHGRLAEAMQVFNKVSMPTIHNWTTITFAYATHGEAAHAIRLYRQMLESTAIKPDNRLYVAVLKACAIAGDLVAGKEVHAHICACPGRSNIFVQAALVNMYAKCGSLLDARRLFDILPARNVVTWTALIAGYTQQGMGQEALSLYSRMQQEGLTPNSVTYVCLLQACASVGVGAIDQGKHLHAQIEQRGLQKDLILGGSLVNMYAKCGSLGDARRLFDRLAERNVVTWTALMAGYTQQGMGEEALSLYSQMRQEGLTSPNYVTYVCLLHACASVGVGALDQGKQLHAQIEERGLQHDLVLGGSLVKMYAKCGCLGEARMVFDRLPERDVVTCTVLIAGYTQQGLGQEALNVYSSMQNEGRNPDNPPDCVTYTCLLQACAIVGVDALDLGKQLHAEIEGHQLQVDLVLGGSLVNMYVKCGSLVDARRVFDSLPERDVVTWTALISGYGQQGMGREALSLYNSMQQEGLNPPDSVTYVCLLQACANVGVAALDQGKQLHAASAEHGLHKSLVLGGSLVNMYAKCSSLGDARRVFDSLPEKDVVTWTALMSGYVQQGMGQEALSLYTSMQHEGLASPNAVTYVCLLHACASVGVGAVEQGKRLHAEIEELGVEELVLGGALVNMYAKCGSLGDARMVFDRLPERDVVTWTALIGGYAQRGMGQEALTLYRSMQREGVTVPNSVTYLCLLQACASVGVAAMDQGKQLHVEIGENVVHGDLALGGSLVNMYAKCGSLGDAHKVFDRLPERDVVTWTALIAGYAQQGMCQEALNLYRRMHHEGLTVPNSVTYLCLLQACASVAALPLGKQLHVEIQERGLQADVAVGASLVTMYAKCGSMCDSQQVFDLLPDRLIEAWNALCSGYARQGDSDIVFDLVDRMRLQGVQPDAITFLCLLTVCSHVGQVDKGCQYLEAMTLDYGISPSIEHYMCVMDLLGRAGHVQEAFRMAKGIPFPRDGGAWLTLLGACRKWRDVEIGRQAFEFAVTEDEQNAAPYVLMSHIYASAEMWEAAQEMQARRVQFGAWKKPGQSWWTDMAGVVHTFVVGDKWFDESEGVYTVASS